MSRTKKKLLKRLDANMEALAKSYREKDIASHEKTMAELLWYSSRVPVYFLEGYHEIFVGKVKKHGVGPFLSYYIDYGTRLANIRTKSSLKKYQQLKALYQPRKSRKHENASVFLRKRAGDGFIKYSENVGWAVGMLLYSNIGENYAKTGNFTAETYWRAAALIDRCRNEEGEKEKGLASQSPRTRDALAITRVDMCAILVQGVQSKLQLGEGGSGY